MTSASTLGCIMPHLVYFGKGLYSPYRRDLLPQVVLHSALSVRDVGGLREDLSSKD